MKALSCQRDLFELPNELHYLNCAFMAPLSKRVLTAGHKALQKLQTPNLLEPDDFFADSDIVRSLFARLIGSGDKDRIAIIPSVSYAMATVAQNTPLHAGQNIVVASEQFPSNIYPWKRMCTAFDAEMRTVHPVNVGTNRSATWTEAILDSIDERTALIAIPELHWTDGTRFNLKNISEKGRSYGARLVIDGTQSIGASPFDVTDIRPDALICAGYKWLTGPYSLGLAYFGPIFDNGIPLEENWITRQNSEKFSDLVSYQSEYQPSAVRYDVGERSNFILLPMLKAGLEQILEWGAPRIQDYCFKLTESSVAELGDLGCQIESNAWRREHLFGIRLPPQVTPSMLSGKLESHNVRVSFRGDVVRVAPYLYNNHEDMNSLLLAVRSAITDPEQ
tara:strand:+ start:45399 stop:46574 length:1176 start_codon:yes stop_codon:yes gene_type:complete